MAVSVLMVCLGNICRSPLAEAALRRHAAQLGVNATVDSAGTGGWHIGDPPDPRACEVAMRLGGLDITGYRGRQLSLNDFNAFDYIVAMDQSNLDNIIAMRPAVSNARLSMLLDHVPGQEGRAVADPYYGDIADFELCWRVVDAAVLHFAQMLAEQNGTRC